MEQKKHIVIFSHGFGTRKDDRGLLSDIANSFSETQSMLFDYNGVDETGKILTIPLLSVQAETLMELINKVRTENPDAIIDIVAHSQGCVVVALTKPTGIRKVIFITPSLDNSTERLLNLFKNRPGTEINLLGVSKLMRKDGTISIVPTEFWQEREKTIPIPIYNEFFSKTELIIINAKQDDIHDSSKTEGINEKIKIIELDGDHQFSGESRKSLINIIKNELM